MPEQKLYLLQLSASSPAQLRAAPPQVVGSDARNTGRGRILLEELPNDLLAHAGNLNPISSVHPAQDRSFGETGRGSPGINGALDPRRHRNRAHAPVLSNEIDDAPAIVPLLDMPKCQGSDLGPPQAAAKQNRQHRAVAQALLRGRVGRIQ